MDGDDVFTLDAVFICRQRSWQNGYRVCAKYNPGAVDRYGEPIRNAGKASKGAHWREDALENPPLWVRQRPDSDALGTGFLTGEFIPFDVDVDDQELCDRIVAMIERRAGRTRLVRQGRAPKLALCYRRDGQPWRRIATTEMKIGASMPGPLGPGERKVMVECLAEGQSLTVFGIHPETGEPYRWLDQSPLDVPLSELPPIDEPTVREIIAEAEKLLRDAGAVDIRLREEKPRRERRSKGSDFFARTNDWALRESDRWVPQIFPQARRQGNGAWRIPATLRGLPASKQDISIYQSGIRDFHEDRAMSAIDFVLEYGHGVHRGAASEAGLIRVKPENEDLFDAAAWLLKQIGISPEDVGWQPDRDGPPPYEEIPERHLRGPDVEEPGGGSGGPGGPPPDPPPPERVPPGPLGELPLIMLLGGHATRRPTRRSRRCGRRTRRSMCRTSSSSRSSQKRRISPKASLFGCPASTRSASPHSGGSPARSRDTCATTTTANCCASTRQSRWSSRCWRCRHNGRFRRSLGFARPPACGPTSVC
jgi:hypothetical protein